MAAKLKHIGIFTPSLAGGGVQRAMLNLSRSFVELGYTVDMILVKASGPFLTQVPEKVRVIDLGATRALSALPRLISYLQKNNPSFLISGQTHINAIAILGRWLSKANTRLIVTEQNDLLRAMKADQNIKEKFRPFIVRFLYLYAENVVAISQGVAEDLKTVSRGKLKNICIINNPIDIKDIQQKALASIQHQWFIQKEIPVILAAGRLVKQKDFVTLINAFALVRKKMAVHLVILGEGEERTLLENLSNKLGISKDICMPGFTENPFSYMARADVFVLSSIWEGFANVLAEALACSLPVVSTNCRSGPAEILDNGRYGSLVPVGDPEAMAEAIFQELNLLHDKNILRQRANDFSIENLVPKYLEILIPDSEKNS